MKRDLTLHPHLRPLGAAPTAPAPRGLSFGPEGDGGEGDMFRVGDRVLFAINGGKYPGTVTEVKSKEEGVLVHFDSGWTQHLKPNMYSRLSFDEDVAFLTNIYGTLDVGDRFFVSTSEWEAGKFGIIESIGKMGAIIRIDEQLYSVEPTDYDLLQPLTGAG